MIRNITIATDGYKLVHHAWYPGKLEYISSYLEARSGSAFPETQASGLQSFTHEIENCVLTQEMIDSGEAFTDAYFGVEGLFNRPMWQHILDAHAGRLPVIIKAVPEGTVVPNSNVLMTIENTDPLCAPLVNHLETLLCQLWHPMNVATISYTAKKKLRQYLEQTSDPSVVEEHLKFMLHDFGYRGVSSTEAAGRGGAAHLINFLGTDTIAAIEHAQEYYGPKDQMFGFSVPASEHSVMTSRGRAGEFEVVADILDKHPTGVVSVVSDSYDIYEACRQYGTRFKDQILSREGKFVVRPDSGNPIEVTLKCLDILADYFGTTTNTKGYKVLPPQVGMLWGDGIDLKAMISILDAMKSKGYAASNIVFGMGGGLLQRHDRDTQRFAFKASAMKIDGEWTELQKDPIHGGKKSKPGRLKLSKMGSVFYTQTLDQQGSNELVVAFEDGFARNKLTFNEVREIAAQY